MGKKIENKPKRTARQCERALEPPKYLSLAPQSSDASKRALLLVGEGVSWRTQSTGRSQLAACLIPTVGAGWRRNAIHPFVLHCFVSCDCSEGGREGLLSNVIYWFNLPPHSQLIGNQKTPCRPLFSFLSFFFFFFSFFPPPFTHSLSLTLLCLFSVLLESYIL